MAKKKTSKPAQEEVITLDIKPLLTPIAIILSTVILAVILLIGLLSINSTLKDFGDYSGTKDTKGVATAEDSGTTTDTQGDQVDIENVQALFTDDNITFGNSDADLIFVEVSDPSCPYCHIAGGHNPELAAQVGERFKYDTDGGSYIPPVREMKKLVGDGKAAYVWQYKNGHSNGELAAQALYCAYEQDKFWDVQALLMSNEGYSVINEQVQNDVSKSGDLASFLSSAIDKSFMKDCLESEKYADKLSEDEATTTALGTQGTPGLYVNEEYYRGAYSYSDMEAAVDEALN